MAKQQKIALLGVYIRGIAMGAADIVPGVSGGTIALMTGIYTQLIESLTQIGRWQTLTELRQGQFQQLVSRVNFFFLIALFTGILTSVIALSTLITFLIATYPMPLWSFFLGLVFAGAFVMFRDLKRKSTLGLKPYMLLFFGFIGAILLGRLTPQDFDVQYWHYFAGGAVAICAMILPGVSGSYLLLMMGLYSAMLQALQSFAIIPIVLFMGGCGAGLLSFSHLLSWCLSRYPQASYSFLIGLMLGAIEKLWPWKEVVETRVNRDGAVVPLIEKMTSPFHFETLYNTSNMLEYCVLTFCIGFLCILVMSRMDSLD